jgi:hypothetical protein
MPKTRKVRKGGAAPPPSAICQCYAAPQQPCSHVAEKGSLFCPYHKTCTGSPLSGSEPKYSPGVYNGDESIYKSHNCYSYGMNVLDKYLIQLCKKYGNCRRFFHQPGAKSGRRNYLNRQTRLSCPTVELLQHMDTPEIQKTDFETRCPRGMSKIALVVHPGEDFHYYRQDSNGMWSHKDGSNKVKNWDALKRRIFSPETSSRDYRWQGSDLNYRDFCGFYCVPRNHPLVLGSNVDVSDVQVVRRATRRRIARRSGGHRGTRRREPFSRSSVWRD